jgi:hypothetical protein
MEKTELILDESELDWALSNPEGSILDFDSGFYTR